MNIEQNNHGKQDQNTYLAQYYDLLEKDSGEFKDNLDLLHEGGSLPFLSIMQALSPQLDKDNDEKYIEGMERGDIYFPPTNEFFSGNKGIDVIPLKSKKYKVEYNLENKPIGNHSLNSETVIKAKKGEKPWELITIEGTILKDAIGYFVLFNKSEKEPIEKEQEWKYGIISMKSSSLAIARGWNTRMKLVKLEGTEGIQITPPIFAYCYHLKTISVKKDTNKWHAWEIGEATLVSMDLYTLAKETALNLNIDIFSNDNQGLIGRDYDNVAF